jgi:hypothetical protein
LYANTNGQGGSGTLGQGLRVQEINDASLFPQGAFVIQELRWRPNAILAQAFTATVADLQINLSSSTAQPDALSATFANNVGADDTQVFCGSNTLSSAFAGPTNGPRLSTSWCR